MKLSPKSITGVVAASIAAVSTTVAVVLKKKSSAARILPQPRASFSASEWAEHAQKWPVNFKEQASEAVSQVESMVKDANQLSAREKAVADAKQHKAATPAKKPAKAPRSASKQETKQAKPEPKKSPTVTPVVKEPVVIGDEPGQVKAFSPAYKKVIKSAYKDALVDDSATLELYGKTYGLGARGHKIVDAEYPGVLYAADDIVKLYKKISS